MRSRLKFIVAAICAFAALAVPASAFASTVTLNVEEEPIPATAKLAINSQQFGFYGLAGNEGICEQGPKLVTELQENSVNPIALPVLEVPTPPSSCKVAAPPYKVGVELSKFSLPGGIKLFANGTGELPLDFYMNSPELGAKNCHLAGTITFTWKSEVTWGEQPYTVLYPYGSVPVVSGGYACFTFSFYNDSTKLALMTADGYQVEVAVQP